MYTKACFLGIEKKIGTIYFGFRTFSPAARRSGGEQLSPIYN
jgi:hypothetical protein